MKPQRYGREVVRLRFPEEEEGITFYLYLTGDDNWRFRMDNGDCIGELVEDIADYETCYRSKKCALP